MKVKEFAQAVLPAGSDVWAAIPNWDSDSSLFPYRIVKCVIQATFDGIPSTIHETDNKTNNEPEGKVHRFLEASNNYFCAPHTPGGWYEAKRFTVAQADANLKQALHLLKAAREWLSITKGVRKPRRTGIARPK